MARPRQTHTLLRRQRKIASARLAKPVLAEPPRRILGVVRQDRIRPRALEACHRLRSENSSDSVVDDTNVKVAMATAIRGAGVAS